MTFVQQHDGEIEPTVNAQVFRQIRIDIVTCRLMPNERLRVESLRKRYGVGGSPIREALMRLEAEGLVILEQNKGFRVSPASREHLLDLMKTRVEIEGLALRWSIEKGGVDWEANLLAAYHRLSHQKKTLRGSGNEINLVWFKEHRNFHSALTAACASGVGAMRSKDTSFRHTVGQTSTHPPHRMQRSPSKMVLMPQSRQRPASARACSSL